MGLNVIFDKLKLNKMGFFWYSRFLSRHPYIVLVSIFVLSSISLIVPLSVKRFPDFSDPQLGFEARGTILSQRLIAWKNLIDSESSKRYFIDNPLEFYYYFQEINLKHETELNVINPILLKKYKSKKNYTKSKKRNKTKIIVDKSYKVNKTNTLEELLNLKNNYINDNKNNSFKKESEITQRYVIYNTDEFFCNIPSTAYARVVISSKAKYKNLWSLESILAQCQIDTDLRSSPHFSLLCQRRLKYNKKCCRSWSVANYIAILSNKTSCLTITELDLVKVNKLLQTCSYFYENLELTFDCAENLICQRKVPAFCYAYDAVYYLLHYLLDIEFKVNSNNSNNSLLRSVMIILPIATSSENLDYYNDISVARLNHKSLYVAAVQFGLKNTLFDQLLISDSFLILFGFGFITICIWSYTGSFLITIATFLVIIFSLVISYAIYTLVLKINFFPFMNLLTIIVAVGIGADDAFIFCKVWECNKRKKSLNMNNGLTCLVHETMKHAIPSMFVTTLTTSIAFFVSIISNVTAVNCFSIFSGIIVVINFLLMLTWLPACVIIAENSNDVQIILPRCSFSRKIIQDLQVFLYKVTYSFTNVLILIVISLKWFWFVFFFALGIGSSCIVFKFPGLQLPDSQEFQLFDSSHLFEQYDLVYTKRFRFENDNQDDNSELLPLRFVWGILPVDNGNYLNPESRGDLIIDDSFNISDQKSQIWLQNFCKNLRLQSFYQNTPGPLLPNCFIESLQHWMERRCEDPIDSAINRSPCCENSTFPYKPNILNRCTAEAIAEIHRTPSHLWNFKSSQISHTAGVKFLKNNMSVFYSNEKNNSTLMSSKLTFKIQVVIVEYDSNIPFSMSFAEMNKFFNQVETWMQDQLSTAPHGMKNGWFVSDLEFYELQRTLYEGTIWSIIVSMILTLFILAFVTLNPIISLFAILSVGVTIAIAVAGLIFIGWKLNVLENITISTAIGLAVDFNLHYGVSYRINTANNRLERVKIALEQMSGPTLMAALTTSVAGALMLPSQVLPYIQIGIFLVLIMGVSWICATFFFCPLLSIGGPSKFLQFDFLRFNTSLLHSKKNKKMTTIVNESIELPIKEKKSTEISIAETTNNTNKEFQFHRDSSLPTFTHSIIHNAEIHYTTSNSQRPDLDS